MKGFLAVAALAASLASAHAQTALTGLTAPPGQTPGGINAQTFGANTQPSGFAENALATVVAAGTTQATAPVLVARTTIITSCPLGAGVQLPSVTRYVPIVVVNRSGAACLVYPSPGATLETAAGTAGAVNAPASVATNTDTTWRPVSATSWLQ